MTTALSTNRFLRQLDLVDGKIFKTPITCIGAGGTGSFIVLTLAKMGFGDITVYDDDTIEEHNISNQFYRLDQIGQEKVYALAQLVEAFDGVKIVPYASRWDSKRELNGCVITAVDNMETRKAVFNACRRNPYTPWIIDPRIGGQQVEVYTVNMQNTRSKQAYEKSLWDDRDTSPLPCTAQAIMYTALSAASFVSNQVRLALSGEPYHNCVIFDANNVNIVQLEER